MEDFKYTFFCIQFKPYKCAHLFICRAFIVNLGDMLERWSNCIFRSTLHRVLSNGQERYSIAFFVEPSHECIVECLPTCQSEKNPPKFPPVKCKDYLSQKYKDTHADLSSYT
ncbi:2-oxoglutarate-Fe(II) type oxidoreductase hxnY-like [Salvia splendens]|uniref:2-oxoglutarate-Fe(II) type oxidoreductase hxnY-like n=1 Tax=Salvia splendens TaxID=180675 RepID=UPI001C25F917|nr:2-oxoglutarate-Fe(II) type oxidoreductase hxnY-like [Salvia splendens]